MKISFLCILFLFTACYRPLPTTMDVAVRPDTGYSEKSSLTLTKWPPSDPVLFKPDLERAFLRAGFNIISDATAQTTIESEEKSKEKTKNTDESAPETTFNKLTKSGYFTSFKSDYVGLINYWYEYNTLKTERLVVTVFELKTGTIISSMSIENPEKLEQRYLARQLTASFLEALKNKGKK